MLESLISLLCSLCKKRQLHINNDFSVTGWMLYVIPHIHKGARYHSESDHKKNINNLIKILFHGLYVYKMAVTQDLFWSEYTEFDKKNGSFDGD